MIDRFGGVPIVVVRPVVSTVVRTWRERLCSWPWRPWARTKQVVVHHPLVGEDEALLVAGSIYCGATYYRKLREAIEERTPKESP